MALHRYIAHIIFGICFLGGAHITFALDIEELANGMQRHGSWLSFSIADPIMGRVVATRAGTEDKRTNATLVLTYSVDKHCSLIESSLILKTTNIGPAIEPSSRFGVFQIDDRLPETVEALVQRERNSNFIFLSIQNRNLDLILMEGRSLMVNYKGFGVINFSLSGANSALKRAITECRNYLS